MLAAMRRLAIVLTAAASPVARSFARRVTPNAPRPRTRPRVKRSVTGGGGGDWPLRTRKSSKGGSEREEEAKEAAEPREATETRLLPGEGWGEVLLLLLMLLRGGWRAREVEVREKKKKKLLFCFRQGPCRRWKWQIDFILRANSRTSPAVTHCLVPPRRRARTSAPEKQFPISKAQRYEEATTVLAKDRKLSFFLFSPRRWACRGEQVKQGSTSTLFLSFSSSSSLLPPPSHLTFLRPQAAAPA